MHETLYESLHHCQSFGLAVFLTESEGDGPRFVPPNRVHEVLLVLDATSGQNALNQARIFKEAVEVTGVFLAKLDGTARGGIVVAIRDELQVPVKLVGLGERPEDVEAFDGQSFIDEIGRAHV